MNGGAAVIRRFMALHCGFLSIAARRLGMTAKRQCATHGHSEVRERREAAIHCRALQSKRRFMSLRRWQNPISSGGVSGPVNCPSIVPIRQRY